MITLEIIKKDHAKEIEEWLACGNEIKKVTRNANSKSFPPRIPKAPKKKTSLPKMSKEDSKIVNNWVEKKKGRLVVLAKHIGVSLTTMDAIRKGKVSCVPSRLNAIMNFIEMNNG